MARTILSHPPRAPGAAHPHTSRLAYTLLLCLSTFHPSFASLAPSSARATASESDPGCSPSPYIFYWNVGGADFVNLDVSPFLMAGGNATQTGGACTQPNCTAWSAGLWPTISDSGAPSYGGVPQAGNLTAHLDVIAATIDGWIPDPAWAGNAVFDFESWTPIWEQNTSPDWYHGARYQNLSRALVAAAHPTWNDSQIEAQARLEFNAAAISYFVETLKLCAKLRPAAKWGYYGFPDNPYGPCVDFSTTPLCGYRNPIVGPVLQAVNDQLAPLWNVTGAYYPSIYMPAGVNTSLWVNVSRDYVAGTVEEAARLRSVSGRDAGEVPILPFAWSYYHDAVAPLLPEDLQSELTAPLDTGAAGVIIWGAPDAFGHAAQMMAYLNSSLGPATRAFTQEQCACAATQCSGHGACVADGCRCFDGYSGANCSVNALLPPL